jgi:P-type Ca2+ transporter type 2C
VLTLILATVFGPLQKLLETTSLDVQQWLICSCVALSIIVVSEIRKAVRRRTGGTAPAAPARAESPTEG